ncbi:toxin YdaT family protein [Cronobacter dublinensis]|uniref:toxin YdaT family protein n=1 Tax=Cronobacter dublinensis TaxID=413497 RepID=UPI00300DD01D
MEIKNLGMELEQWAAEKGWKTITPMITAHHSGGLLESLSVEDAKEYSRRLHNNAQIIKRAFRGNSPKYRRNAEVLSYAVKAAMNAELAERREVYALVAVATQEGAESTNAVLLGKPDEIVVKETIEAIIAYARLLSPRYILLAIYELLKLVPRKSWGEVAGFIAKKCLSL